MYLQAEGPRELNRKLSGVDISVPPREAKRTSEDCERWSMVRFLATLNRGERLSFPITVIKGERPDFVIKQNDVLWGVEITEAIPTSYAKALSIAARENPDAIIDKSLFKFGKDKSREEIQGIINASELSGQGWFGYQPEKELAEAIEKIVDKKTQKLCSSHFSRYPINILLIYNNMPLPSLNTNITVNFVTKALKCYWGDKSVTFDSIYIEHSDSMLSVTKTERMIFEIPNLWAT